MTVRPTRRAAAGPGGNTADDAGFTLIEMVVTCSLLVVVVGIVLSAFTSFQSAVASNMSRQTTIEQAELAMQTLSRDFRAVAPSTPGTYLPDFTSATATAATFRANLDTMTNPAGGSGAATGYNGCPDQVAISVAAGGTLTETRVRGTNAALSSTNLTGCSFTGTPIAYVVGTRISINLVYLPYNASTDPSTWATSIPTAPPSVLLQDIAFVRITVTATSTQQAVAPTTLTQTVRLALTSIQYSNG